MMATDPSSAASNLEEPIEPWLLNEISFHGFLPREDIVLLLQKHGDYIVRMSEVDPLLAKGAVSKGAKKQVQLVLSILMDPEGKCQGGPVEQEVKAQMVRSLIIQRMPTAQGDTKFLIQNVRFDSLSDLLKYYTNTPVKIASSTVLLIRPIRLAKWEYYHKDVSIGKVLGKGAYGEVKKGTLKRKSGKMVTVAMKQLKTSSLKLSKEKIEEMMNEARLMRGMSHPNIVKMYGVALTEQPLLILLEFVHGGSLDSYLKHHADIIDRDEKMQMCMGACWGLTYIHNEGILHRDIAARNCLYDSSKNVKISDFGLSRQATVYKMKTAMKMPIKWMAPESIQAFSFSQKTDVYSLGILFNEIMNCRDPYDGYSNGEAKKAVLEGKFSSFPESTHPKLVEYIKEKMWNKEPGNRATSQHVQAWMETFTGLSLVIDEEKESAAASKSSSKMERRHSAENN